jgi:hypothetical protein
MLKLMNYLRSFFARYVDPAERLTEVLFGLLMVLTCTLGASLTVEEGREATREMLLAALGCNVAWGFINGVIYVMDSMYERGRGIRLVQCVLGAADEEGALGYIERELDPTLAALSSKEERERLYREVLTTIKNAPPPKRGIQREDLIGATITFVLMFLIALMAIMPFLFLRDLLFALRVSNGLLLGLLFVVGYRWGRETGTNPWLGGLAMTLIGGALVGIAKVLGG